MNSLLVPEDLEQDRKTLKTILNQRRTTSTQAMPDDLRFLWQTYLVVLESALNTVDGLIAYRRNRK